MSTIDPTARVEDGAVIGEATSIGPYCIIGPNVIIGANCKLIAHVHITAQTTIGDDTDVGHVVTGGGLAAVHQFPPLVRPGLAGRTCGARTAMVPAAIAASEYAGLSGLHLVGTRRRSFPGSARATTRWSCQKLY